MLKKWVAFLVINTSKSSSTTFWLKLICRNKHEKMANVSRHTSDPLLSEGTTRESDDVSNYYERRVQTLATIGRSPSRVPRDGMIYKERVWLNASTSPTTRFQTLPCHYSLHQGPSQTLRQHGSHQVLSQV